MTLGAFLQIESSVRSLLGSDFRKIAPAVKSLSDSFTKKRDELPRNYLSDLNRRRAYIAGFLLPNAAKVLRCLEEASQLDAISEEESISMLDVGSGPATASLAASVFFGPSKKLSVTTIEQSKEILSYGKKLFQSLEIPKHSFETIVERVTPSKTTRELGKRRFDIIVVANLLNEFEGDGVAFKLINTLITNHLKKNGIMILIDPALRKTTRYLMNLRDRILDQNGDVDLIAPCLHRQNCPMLEKNDRDWCHLYLEWQRPKLIEELDELTGLDRRYLKMAYFIFRRAISKSHNSRHWRVISSPLISKGKQELMLCGSSGVLKRVMRLDREKSETNMMFEEAKRGDIIETDSTKRIHPEDSFQIIRKYNP